MSDVQYNTIGEEEEGQRLDNYLLRVLKGVPKSHIYRIIRAGEVRVNKKRAQASTKLCTADLIRIPPLRLSEKQNIEVHKSLEKYLEKSIIYEDKTLLVINKPAGIAVHGGSGLSLGIIEAFRKMRPDENYLELAHRLDKETSGCLLLAKKRSTLRSLQEAFTERKIKKTYWVLLSNHWNFPKKHMVRASLLKNTLKSGERMVSVTAKGKSAETQFKLLENYRESCWIEAKPLTGRTHQIRIHASYIGHPVIGDTKYGKNEPLSHAKITKNRLYLHARAIEFTLDSKTHRYEAALDECFMKSLIELQKTALYKSKSIALRK